MLKKLKEFQKKIMLEPLEAVYSADERTFTLMPNKYQIVKEIRVNNIKIDVPKEAGVITISLNSLLHVVTTHGYC